MPFNLFSKCYNKGSFDRQNVLSIEEQHDVSISIYSYLSTKIVKLLLIMMDWCVDDQYSKSVNVNTLKFKDSITYH